jgi:hypothetical protein
MMERVNLGYIVSTFANVTMYPQYNNNMIMKTKNQLTWIGQVCFIKKQRGGSQQRGMLLWSIPHPDHLESTSDSSRKTALSWPHVTISLCPYPGSLGTMHIQTAASLCLVHIVSPLCFPDFLTFKKNCVRERIFVFNKLIKIFFIEKKMA